MKPRPRRSCAGYTLRPNLDRLESRLVLSGTSATWLGQDGHDLAGPSSGLASDGIQDVHIQISGIPNNRQIAWADLMGLGGGRWVYKGPYGPWGAALDRSPGAPVADLFFEPDRAETGRAFNLVLHYDDGTSADLWLDGGTADPGQRMPSAQLQLSWVGQTGTDLTGQGPAVGPDGYTDAILNLRGLTSNLDIASVQIQGPPGLTWAYGPNPQAYSNAELVRNSADPSQAQLFLSPSSNLQGQTLTVQVNYASGQTDKAQVVASSTNPTQQVSKPALPQLVNGPSAQWLGQASGQVSGVAASQGWATLGISGIPAGRSIVAAAVTGVTNTIWAYRAPSVDPTSFYVDPYAQPLAYLPGTDATSAKLAFAPDTTLTGQRLSIRLRLDDGSQVVTSTTAGVTDLSKLSPAPSTNTVVAGAGADIQSLVNKFGKVLLSPGVYTLNQPLTINTPVSLIAPYGNVTLQFNQQSSSASWSAAIKINAGNTTLSGFAVRFSGPVRWNWDVDYGPTIIGSTDNLDPSSSDPRANLVLTNLDLQSPAPATQNEQAPNLIRLATAEGGTISSNKLRGGTTVVVHGPWSITGNSYLGTVPGTWAWEAFATHFSNNLVLSNNTVSPLPGSGRTWRFLVMTHSGLNDQVSNNQVSGIGPLDTDTQSVNASELILTESYSLRFEGMPLSLSSDGRVLQIPAAQGATPATGDIVAILNGPNSGLYRRVAQVLDPNTLLLSDPLPAGSYAVSIASGFVNETFSGNTVDARGSSTASPFVLVGNHYGTQLTGNTTYGGGEAIRVVAYPTEAPQLWGWSHDPFLGGTISNNTVVDSSKGITLNVDNSPSVKTTTGRTYFQASVQGNTIRWTSQFLAARAAANLAAPVAMTVGDPRALDPAGLALTLNNNWGDVPQGAIAAATINMAQINGQILLNSNSSLAAPPPGTPASLSLVNDTGSSSSDKITNDSRIRIGNTPGATSYQYRLANSGSFLTVSDPSGFQPAGLTDGPATVFVRGVNVNGVPGTTISLNFTLDSTPPVAQAPPLTPQSDTGPLNTDDVTSANALIFQADGNSGDILTLLRNGSTVAQGGPGTLTDPGPIPEGTHLYSLRRTDIAGNSSVSSTTQVVIDRTPPAAPTGLIANGTTVSVSPANAGSLLYYQVNNNTAQPVPTAAGFTPQGLVPGNNQVTVCVVDQAGNVGPSSIVNVLYSPGPVSALWLGQDGKDYVGSSATSAGDGIQDIHIRMSGLPTNRMIKLVDIQGQGGGQWQFGTSVGFWRAAVFQQVLAGTADIYINPDRTETGRPFQITVTYGDNSTSTIWLQGGTANPGLTSTAHQARVLASRRRV